MDDEDFLAVIEELERQLRAHDASGIADPKHYVWRDDETGEYRVHEPRKRLVLMLEAFGRKLAIEDRATFQSAIAKIVDNVLAERPVGAIVETVDGRTVDLAKAPDLQDVRRELSRFIGQVHEARPPTPPAVGFD